MKPGPKSVHASDDRPTQARRRAGPVLAGVLLVASCAHQPAHDPQAPGAASGAQAISTHAPGMHAAHAAHAGTSAAAAPGQLEDRRQPVEFPPVLREHTLSNMRDHLLALQQIQKALSEHAFDRSADVAEHRLGMSSLALHGAHEVARYMPRGMQEAGTAMHRSASRFAIASRDAGASGDLRPALAALSDLTSTCVACHAAYRLK